MKNEKEKTSTKPKTKEIEKKEEGGSDRPDTPKGFDSSLSRAHNRKNWTSRRWHWGFDEARRKGLSDEEATEAARSKSQSASLEFDKLWPKDLKKKNEEDTSKEKAGSKKKSQNQGAHGKKPKKTVKGLKGESNEDGATKTPIDVD